MIIDYENNVNNKSISLEYKNGNMESPNKALEQTAELALVSTTTALGLHFTPISQRFGGSSA
jgi:hypothetical protein